MPTPKEAKEKQCCVNVNRACVADRCMGWDWSFSPERADAWNSDKANKNRQDYPAKARGYCGRLKC